MEFIWGGGEAKLSKPFIIPQVGGGMGQGGRGEKKKGGVVVKAMVFSIYPKGSAKGKEKEEKTPPEGGAPC